MAGRCRSPENTTRGIGLNERNLRCAHPARSYRLEIQPGSFPSTSPIRHALHLSTSEPPPMPAQPLVPSHCAFSPLSTLRTLALPNSRTCDRQPDDPRPL